jgi:hypothetical protein
MSTFIGFDNAELLPPFVPVYRNEDGLFGLTLWRCFDDAYSCDLPWVLLHAPTLRRGYYHNALSTVRAADILAACMISCQNCYPSQPPTTRMRLLGTHLQELAARPSPDFKTVLLRLLRKRAFELIARRETLLVQHGAYPLHWASEVRAQIHSLRGAVSDSAYPIPVDMGGEFSDAAECLGAVQQLVGRFGQLLYWWPAIVERATDLRERGFELGRRIQ